MLNTKRLASASSRLVRMMSHVTSSEAASVPWKEIRIPVPWGHIAGKEWGVENGEPILGLHGWQDNSAAFDRLAPLLPLSRMRFIALDLPGHGLSSHLPEGAWYRWSDYVLSLARVADHLKWNQFSLVSHSMGAKISYIYAGCFPERVKRMVELDMPRPVQGISRVLKIPKTITKWDLADIYRNWVELTLKNDQAPVGSRGRPMDEFVEIMVNATSLTKDTARVILNRGTRLVSRDPDLYVLTRDRRLNIYDFLLANEHYEQIFRNISCELLVIYLTSGQNSVVEDAYAESFFNNKGFYVSTLDKFKKRLKVFRWESIDGSHHIHLTNPERVSSIIGEFLIDVK